MSHFDEIAELIHDTIDDDSVTLTRDSAFTDLPNWDSVTAMRLIAPIEAEFSIKLPIKQYLATQTVGKLEDLITQLENAND